MKENLELRFKPIDFDTHADLCVAFRADAFVCSFGSDKRFFESDGKGHERYLESIKQRSLNFPGSCVHVWKGDVVIGQIELNQFNDDPHMGYVHFYYLAREYRNQGLGSLLDEYARQYLALRGFRKARLRVSPTNEQARRFYLKNGWRDLGPRPDRPHVNLMEIDLV